MRRLIIAVTLLALAALPAAAEHRPPTATVTEAEIVAANWIALILHSQGHWGGAGTAALAEVRPFQRGGRLLGYLCRVEPQGFIIVSLRRELSPVKACSETSGLDPESDAGIADAIKLGMEQELDAIEVSVPSRATAGTAGAALEGDRHPAWDELGRSPDAFRQRLESDTVGMTLEQVGPLLTSSWHQDDPYHDRTPEHTCDGFPVNTPVGCVAIAGAQIMRYWAWPPYGIGVGRSDPYDWPNMPDTLKRPGSTPTQIDAVAELCVEIGFAVDMDYGCEESAAPLANVPGKDMLDAYEDYFRYDSAAGFLARGSLPAALWFNLIKSDLNKNRPVHYITDGSAWWKPLSGGHSMVCDGWRETGSLRLVAMNYGAGPDEQCDGHACNFWYSLDEPLPTAKYASLEMIITGLRPVQALGATLSGSYTARLFPYRYFDQNATGGSATFEPGQLLQFLAGTKVRCTSTSGGSIRFRGSTGATTRLFTGGDEARGIRIWNGHVDLQGGGSLKLY